MTKEIPQTLIDAALRHRKKITHSDPGIALIFDEAGLTAHSPNGNPQTARQLIQQSITNAGMIAADLGASEALFTGTMAQVLRAQDAVHMMAWTHHQPNSADIGRFYLVTPRGGSNVEFNGSELVFNA